MIWLILLALVVVVAAIVFYARSASGPPSPRPVAPQRGDRPAPAASKRGKSPSEAADEFRGVMLFPQKDCCEAVLKLRGRTFPERSAPALPVPDCGRESCNCQLHQVVGRRRGPRRLIPDRRSDVRFLAKGDRRKGKDRRGGVNMWDQSA